jgi:hypothetical protein
MPLTVEHPYYQFISKEMNRLEELKAEFAVGSEEYQAYDDMSQALWDVWCDKAKDKR